MEALRISALFACAWYGRYVGLYIREKPSWMYVRIRIYPTDGTTLQLTWSFRHGFVDDIAFYMVSEITVRHKIMKRYRRKIWYIKYYYYTLIYHVRMFRSHIMRAMTENMKNTVILIFRWKFMNKMALYFAHLSHIKTWFDN